jgi:hypothetical protein
LWQIVAIRASLFDEGGPRFDKGERRAYIARKLMAGGTNPGMERVRIGLTGLAFVFLAVLLAMVFIRQEAGEEPITPNLLEQQRLGQPAATEPEEEATAPAEPLAELGVAPGKAETNAAEVPSEPPVVDEQ